MKKIFVFFLALGLMSCVDSLDDYNLEKKKAITAPPSAMFDNAVKNLSDGLNQASVNINNFRFYVQYWTGTTYLDEPRYNLTSRPIPDNWWRGLYATAIADLKESKRLVEADLVTDAKIRNNRKAQLELMEVYAWSILVNTFGNVPYTEAFDSKKTLPKYDDAATIYEDLLLRLDAALALITPTSKGFNDLVYQGSMTSWSKFGNSLKLRMAMVIADKDAVKSKKLAEEAAPNVITSSDDNWGFPYQASPPNHNPAAASLNIIFTTRQDYVGTSSFINVLKDLNDPRLPIYFNPVASSNTYVGGNYGFSNTASGFSRPGEKIIDPALEGLLLDYSEVEFLLAEAAERGYTLTGSASGSPQEHYNKAIKASILYWGGSGASADAYLSQPKVNYTTATGNYKQKIGTQKWIALYNRGFDAWVEWRRLDYPVLLPPTGGNAPVGLSIPLRLIYPIAEQTLNGVSRSVAAESIGGDVVTTRLFWDIN